MHLRMILNQILMDKMHLRFVLIVFVFSHFLRQFLNSKIRTVH